MCRLARPVLSFFTAASLAATACAPAWANDDTAARKDTLGLHLVSQHVPAANYNNLNPGAYYRLAEGPVAGFYRNSIRRTSVYAGYTFEYKRFDLTAGIVTGYSQGVQPLLVPSIGLFSAGGAQFRLAFIPRFEKRIGSHVFHLAAEI